MMSSLYIGATGLKSHSEGMSVITNNLANVNTVGYKQMSMQYEDLVSTYITAASANLTNTNQKGSGAMPSSNRTLFIQGGYETGSEATDLCINGLGFFGVTKNGQTHYTRAGNFRFTKEGELVDPNGWNVLGRPIINGVESVNPVAIKLDLSNEGFGYMAPQATSKVSSSSNLGGLEDKSADAANPFFALASSWKGSSSTPLAKTSYSYSEPFQFYDANGDMQSATIYYDKAGSSGGMTAVEYVVAMDPSLDTSALSGTTGAGLLMAGTITFSSSGQMINMTAFSPPASGNPADLSGWTPASLQNGQPAFTAQTKAGAQTIALDMGYTFADGASSSGGLASAADAAGNTSAIYYNNPAGQASAQASKALGTSQSTLYASRDGYAPGYLRDLQVTRDGIVRGTYTNSQTEDLYRISLYRFTSQDGLRHEGNNHYSATPESGAAQEGVPGDENFGTLSEYALEQSNVDYAREFSLLIVTQRGFQMNSKVITTTDTMLQKALELKR